MRNYAVAPFTIEEKILRLMDLNRVQKYSLENLFQQVATTNPIRVKKGIQTYHMVSDRFDGYGADCCERIELSLSLRTGATSAQVFTTSSEYYFEYHTITQIELTPSWDIFDWGMGIVTTRVVETEDVTVFNVHTDFDYIQCPSFILARVPHLSTLPEEEAYADYLLEQEDPTIGSHQLTRPNRQEKQDSILRKEKNRRRTKPYSKFADRVYGYGKRPRVNRTTELTNTLIRRYRIWAEDLRDAFTGNYGLSQEEEYPSFLELVAEIQDEFLTEDDWMLDYEDIEEVLAALHTEVPDKRYDWQNWYHRNFSSRDEHPYEKSRSSWHNLYSHARAS